MLLNLVQTKFFKVIRVDAWFKICGGIIETLSSPVVMIEGRKVGSITTAAESELTKSERMAIEREGSKETLPLTPRR